MGRDLTAYKGAHRRVGFTAAPARGSQPKRLKGTLQRRPTRTIIMREVSAVNALEGAMLMEQRCAKRGVQWEASDRLLAQVDAVSRDLFGVVEGELTESWKPYLTEEEEAALDRAYAEKERKFGSEASDLSDVEDCLALGFDFRLATGAEMLVTPRFVRQVRAVCRWGLGHMPDPDTIQARAANVGMSLATQAARFRRAKLDSAPTIDSVFGQPKKITAAFDVNPTATALRPVAAPPVPPRPRPHTRPNS